MKKIAVVPTLMTLGNLFCGFIAITQIVDGTLEGRHVVDRKMVVAAWCVFFGMVFDALDGRVARLARVTSGFGAQLDSLADLVTFGLVPALLVRTVAGGIFSDPKILWLVCGAYLVCAALRLARYNVRQAGDKSTHEDFEGLPTPGAAGVVTALVLFACSPDPRLSPAVRTIVFGILPFAALLAAVLMVSGVRYLHIPNRLLGGKRPFAHVVQLSLAMVAAAYWIEMALVAAFVGYLACGLLFGLSARRAADPAASAGAPPPASGGTPV